MPRVRVLAAVMSMVVAAPELTRSELMVRVVTPVVLAAVTLMLSVDPPAVRSAVE